MSSIALSLVSVTAHSAAKYPEKLLEFLVAWETESAEVKTLWGFNFRQITFPSDQELQLFLRGPFPVHTVIVERRVYRHCKGCYQHMIELQFNLLESSRLVAS